MAKRKKYLNYYYRWMKSGKMDQCGLCVKFGERHKFLSLFEPTDDDYATLYRNGMSCTYWASETKVVDYYHKRWYTFGPLRQTILLFMAAMNNEF